MILIKTTSGTVLNLAHAFEFQYDEAKGQLTIWWAFPKAASMYDTERLMYQTVDKSEWLRFLEKNR